MSNLAGAVRNAKTRPFWTMTEVAMLAAMLFLGTEGRPLRAQSAGQARPSLGPTSQAPTSAAPIQQWETDAGGKMSFEIATLKPDASPMSAQTTHTNIALSNMDMFASTNGVLSAANYPLITYIAFAYKLTPFQEEALLGHMPKWATATRYDIEGRAPAKTTKDQFRLMMQSLLADRFKLALHFETRQLPVLAMLLDKPGTFGPKLRLHPADAPCSAPLTPKVITAPTTIEGGFPEFCGSLLLWFEAGSVHVGGRDMPMQVIGDQFTGLANNGIDRAVLDKTELTGRYDFVFNFALKLKGPVPAGANLKLDETAPTFQEALQTQLGLELEPRMGPVDVVVLDHVEEPPAN